MSKLGAAKLMTTVGPVWCHYSKQRDTLKLRRFVEGTAFEVQMEGDEIEDFIPITEIKKQFDGGKDGFSINDGTLWTKILKALESPRATRATTKGRTSKSAIVVPITPLRQFYSVMKLLDVATLRGLAKVYEKAPKSLERLWNNSRAVFDSYNNDAGWGRGNTKTLPSTPSSVAAVLSTNDMTAFVNANSSCLMNQRITLTYVEREVNPWSTRAGVFSDQRPATNSGKGGIDLLLRSDATSHPFVGEIKVKNDKNAFFALIQAMTYAVELSTQNQLRRLKTHYAEHFGELDAKTGKVGIALLMVNSVQDDTRAPIRTLVTELNKNCGCKGLDQIVMIENDGEKWMWHS